MRNPISPERLRKLLRYEPETGKLFWLERADASFNKQFAGTEALTTPTVKGYLHGTILGRRYKAHRVIVALVTGFWPDQVDHENRIKSDNRWGNLKPVTSDEQAKNKPQRSDNTSGHVGICWHPGAGKWMARIGNAYLGIYDDIEDAITARNEAQHAANYHPNHGRKSA